MKLEDLLKHNRSNHYQMLVIVDNNQQHQKIINALKGQGWHAYDVNQEVARLLQDVPREKRKLRIGEKLKEWFRTLPDKVILYNNNILYSPDLGRFNPINAFKYKSRDKELIVIMEGSLSGNRIQYSQHGRPDYVEMEVDELISVRMEDIEIV